MLRRNIFLLVGSNSGDRACHLSFAIESIENGIGSIQARSKIYETAPWGNTHQPDFLNQALQVASELSPIELLMQTQAIERALGRSPGKKWAERSVDIDILFFDDMIIDVPGLVIPHLHLAARRFVLVPLAEISPDFVHPVLQKSTLELLKECRDPLSVKEFRG